MEIDLNKFQEWLDSLTKEDEEKLREDFVMAIAQIEKFYPKCEIVVSQSTVGQYPIKLTIIHQIEDLEESFERYWSFVQSLDSDTVKFTYSNIYEQG